VTQATDRVAGSPKQVDPVALAFELRALLKACHWSHQLQMLEILEWVCGTDRQFDRAKSKAFKLIHQQEDAMVAIVNRQVKGTPRPEETKR
jgi:hypothetical protein